MFRDVPSTYQFFLSFSGIYAPTVKYCTLVCSFCPIFCFPFHYSLVLSLPLWLLLPLSAILLIFYPTFAHFSLSHLCFCSFGVGFFNQSFLPSICFPISVVSHLLVSHLCQGIDLYPYSHKEQSLILVTLPISLPPP